MSLDALSRVIQEFFGSIAALFCGTPDYFYAILYCAGNRIGCTRSLVSRFGDMFSRSFHYGL